MLRLILRLKSANLFWSVLCLTLVLVLNSQLTFAHDAKWTWGLGQGTEEATVRSSDGSIFGIFCSAGADGSAGVLFFPRGNHLTGEHTAIVTLGREKFSFLLANSVSRSDTQDHKLALANFARLLATKNASHFNVTVPDLNHSWRFSLMNARDALSYNDGQSLRLIVDNCVRS